MGGPKGPCSDPSFCYKTTLIRSKEEMTEASAETTVSRLQAIVAEVTEEDELEEIFKVVRARRTALRKASGRAQQSRGRAVRRLGARLVAPEPLQTHEVVEPSEDPAGGEPEEVHDSGPVDEIPGSDPSDDAPGDVVDDSTAVEPVGGQEAGVSETSGTDEGRSSTPPPGLLDRYSSWDQAAATQAWAAMVEAWTRNFAGLSAQLGGFCADLAQGNFSSPRLQVDRLAGQYHALGALRDVTVDVVVLSGLRHAWGADAVLTRLEAEPTESATTIKGLLVALDSRIAVGPKALLLVRRRVIMLLRHRQLYGLLSHMVWDREVPVEEQRVLMAAYVRAVAVGAEMPELPAQVALSLTDPDAYYGFEAVVGHSRGPPLTLDIRWEAPHGVERGVAPNPGLLRLREVRDYLRAHGLLAPRDVPAAIGG